MEPEGVGSGRVEQLSSFAAREAELNALSYVDFYRYVFAPLLGTSVRRLVPSKMSIVEGLGKSAQSWVAALSSALGVANLRFCTLLPFRGVLAPRVVVHPYRSWCPICLQNELTSGETVYEPLVWRISEVEWCPIHGVRLAVCCPECRRGNQTWASFHARAGCCRFCGCWLGRSSVQPEDAPSEFELFCAQACEQLLSLAFDATENHRLLPSDQIASALRDVFFSGSGARMERSLGLPRGQGNHYCAGTFPAPLHYYLRAIYYSGATVREVFASNEFQQKEPQRETLTFPLRRASVRRSLPVESIAAKLREALLRFPPPSVRRIAEELDVDSLLVWRRCAELATDVSARYAAYVAERAAENRKNFRASVRDVFARYGTSISAQDMKHLLGDPSCYLNNWKREIIRDETVDFMCARDGRRPASLNSRSTPLGDR
jgi:hypothetical protein